MSQTKQKQQETSQTILVNALQQVHYNPQQAKEVLQLAERLRGQVFDYDAYFHAQSIGAIRDVERVAQLWNRISPKTASLDELPANQARQIADSKESTTAGKGFIGPKVGLSVKWSASKCQLKEGNNVYDIPFNSGYSRPATLAERNREDLIILETARARVESAERKSVVPTRTKLPSDTF